MEKVSTAEF